LDSDLSYHSYVKASEDKYFIPAFTSEIEQWFPPDLKLEKIGAAPKGGTKIFNSEFADRLEELSNAVTGTTRFEKAQLENFDLSFKKGHQGLKWEVLPSSMKNDKHCGLDELAEISC
jgi:hypothetical protein